MAVTSTSGAWNVSVYAADGVASLSEMDFTGTPLTSAEVTGPIDKALASFDAPSNGAPYAATLTAEITLDQAEDIAFYIFAAGHARIYVDDVLAGEVTVADLPGAGPGPCPANGGAVCLCQADQTYAQERIEALVGEGTREIKIEYLNLDPSASISAQWAVGDIGRRALDLSIPEATVDQDLDGGGEWGDLKDWPLISIHSAVLDDGRVLTYGGDTTGFANGKLFYDVWDPVTDTHIRYDNITTTDLFCAAMVAIPGTSKVIIVGGDALPSDTIPLYRPDATVTTLDGVRDINIFDADTGKLTPAPEGDMEFARWYPTVVTLPTGQVLVLGGRGARDLEQGRGGVTVPELYTYGEGWKTLSGAEDPIMAAGGFNYPRTFIRDDGKIIYVTVAQTGLGDGRFTRSIDGWTATDSAGRWNPTGENFPAALLPDGDVIGYINNGSISADTGATYDASGSYALSMALGSRVGMANVGYEVTVYAGDTILAQQSGTVPGEGGWRTFELSIPSGAATGQSGASLRIEIANPSGAQLNIDDLRLVNAETGATLFSESFDRPGDIGAGHKVMLLDPTGDGALDEIGVLPFGINSAKSSTMFAPNKAMIMANDGMIWSMDFSGDAPVFAEIAQLSAALNWANMVVLPDGTVMIAGGSTQGNREAGANYSAIIVDPVAGTITDTNEDEFNPRLYHSTAVLLRDGTVLTSGGGAAPPLSENSYFDSQVYRPAYLYDENGDPATRPEIVDAPFNANPGQDIVLGVSNASDIARITLVKTNAVTHAVQMDAGFFEVGFEVVSAGQITLSLPDIDEGFRPGNWMLFAWNSAGTPSIAPIVRVNPVLDAATRDPDELLFNGDLEVGNIGLGGDPYGWSVAGAGSHLNDAARAANGEGFYALAAGSELSQTVATESGQIYMLSFTTSGPGDVTVEALNGTIIDVSESKAGDPAGSHTLSFMASGNNTTLRFAAEGVVDIDAVSLRRAADNLLWNGSFEAGAGADLAYSWNVSGPVSTTDSPLHGARSVEIGAGGAVSQTVATSDGQSLVLNFAAAMEQGETVTVDLAGTSTEITKLHGFEGPPDFSVGLWTYAIAGFDSAGSSGAWRPREGEFQPGVLEPGATIGWINRGTVSTVLDETYSGEAQQVSLLLGGRTSLGASDYTLSAFVGAELAATLSGQTADPGTMEEVTLDIPAGLGAGPLRLEITRDGGGQLNFDEIKVTQNTTLVSDSLESAGLANGRWVNGIDGFDIVGAAGTWNPPDAAFLPGAVPDGEIIGWINAGTVSKTLAGSYQAGSAYTFSVDLGARLGWADAGYAVRVMAGDTELGQAAGTLASDGQFQTVSISVSPNAAPGADGQPLRFEIEKTGGAQVNFDAVKLVQKTSNETMLDGVSDGIWDNAVEGWDISGAAGTWDPTARHFDTEIVPEETSLGWINRGSVSREIAARYDANEDMVVGVELGARHNSSAADYALRLYVGDALVAEERGTLTGNGQLVAKEIALNAGVMPAGLPLRLEISKIGGAQVNFGDVYVATQAPGSDGFVFKDMIAIGADDQIEILAVADGESTELALRNETVGDVIIDTLWLADTATFDLI